MELTDYVSRYALENDITPESVEQLSLRASMLTRFSGGALCLCQLTDDLLNRWLVARQQSGLSPNTVHADRGKILALWNSATDAGLCPPPGKIRRIKCPRKPVRAFTHEDMAKLLTVVRKLRGNIRVKRRDTGTPRRLYWLAFILAAYDSGLRRSDLLSVERSWVRPDDGGGSLCLVQRKTGKVIYRRFRQATMQAIDELCNGRTTGPIWCGYPTRCVWCQAFRRLRKRAGVDGSAKWLRRSGASYTAREHGKEAAKQFLGHATDYVADSSYLDLTIAYPSPVLPPPIG